jgi:hypothetical protein
MCEYKDYRIAEQVGKGMYAIRYHRRTPSENTGNNLTCRQNYVHDSAP